MHVVRSHQTRALIHTAHLRHNLELLQTHAGSRPLWPAIKANAYGHGAEIVARHLVDHGYRRLCVAHAGEAIALLESGVDADFIVMSPALPVDAAEYVEFGLEAVVCTLEMAAALSVVASRQNKQAPIHVMVDTGMGRVGIHETAVPDFLARCKALPGISICGVMSHLSCADQADRTQSLTQVERFRRLQERSDNDAGVVYHMANSAAVFTLPESLFDAVRPGIAVYGLNPFSAGVSNPLVAQLRPVMELKTRVSFIKEVDAGVGLSYGHTFRTGRPSLIATVPVGYGDGLSRSLSNRMDMLVQGIRCRQVGTITMDQSLLDVTPLRGRVGIGDEVVIIGGQGDQEISADELAESLHTINYEVVTNIACGVPRLIVD